MTIDTVVFDIGNVLFPWEPRRLFQRLLPDAQAVERFLVETGFFAWNARLDAGLPFADGVAEYGARFPHYRHCFEAYARHWEETVGAPLAEPVALLHELKAAGKRMLALTNFSTETFPLARKRYPFLAEFEGIVVSGEEGLVKPDPAIYRRLIDRYAFAPEHALFIDDSAANVAAARELGFHTIHFTAQDALRNPLRMLGLPV